MAEPQKTAAAGTVADETARLVEALGVWARSVSPSSGTTASAESAASTAPNPDAPPPTQQARPEASADDTRDDTATRDGAAPQREPRSEAPYGVGRCAHCGARTGVGEAVSCRVCPICQGIALLRTVRPETVDRLADLAGAVAATLREVAVHVRTGAHEAGAPADSWDGPATGRARTGPTGTGGSGAPRGPVTVQDIPVGDGDSSDEGDEW
jgi:hypothetical protein